MKSLIKILLLLLSHIESKAACLVEQRSVSSFYDKEILSYGIIFSEQFSIASNLRLELTEFVSMFA